MYAGIIAATGWTWEYIDENMTMPRLMALNRHWKISPPVHQGLARLNSAILKEGSSNKQVDTSDKKRNLRELIDAFGLAGGTVQVVKSE